MLTDVWPLFGLVLRTPRLELRSPSPEQLAALAELADDGVHDPATMPFLVPWTDLPPGQRGRSVDDGTQLEVVRGQRRTELRFRLDRQTWAARQAVPVEIEGLEPCRELLGAVSGAAAPVPGS